MNGDCQHTALILADIKGKFSDDDVRAYICMKPTCGMVVLAAPVQKFKHNPEAKKFLQKIASEIELPTLDKPKPIAAEKYVT